jgi:large subunit ribosomal protein L6
MSRIGKQPIAVPAGVTVTLTRTLATVKEEGGELHVGRPTDSKQHRSLHGLTRSLIAAAVAGVTDPYRKVLEIVGVGYTAKMQGKKITLQIGFCHPVDLAVPNGLTVEAPTNQQIVITGCDKHQVGQFAANIRKVRPPEPYNGKGIRYQGERVVRKAGKSFVSGDK